MVARRSISASLLLASAIVSICPRQVAAQGPTVAPTNNPVPGSTVSRMGRIPGTGGMVFGSEPGADQQILSGGRPGPGVPRVQPAPNMGQAITGRTRGYGITPPARLAVNPFPVYGTLSLPTTAEDEGPPTGLTLDQAIARLVAENLELHAKFYELPQAEADILTASLRANPIFYADTQLIPYGKYTRDRPGGATQSDVNISHPFDLSGKRQARIHVAREARSVLEAQYQNAVRIQIDNLYTAFVDILAARETVRLAEASITGLDRVLKVTETLYEKANATRADVGKVRVQRLAAEVGRDDAIENLRRSKQVLATLLNISADQADSLEIRGRIATSDPTFPEPAELITIALESRPDLAVQRLSLGQAESFVRLARAERFADIYLLYQPYTFQNNQPTGNKSATSWALGGTVPLPLFNRNQGMILRARLNVNQTQVELTGLEQRAVTEVVQAMRDYTLTGDILRRIERDLIPASRQMRDDALRLLEEGELESADFFDRQRLYNEDVRRYRDMLVRHRRGALRLNTVVGRRILP